MAQTPFDILNETVFGYILSDCLNAVAQAGIADVLDDAPRSVEELAVATSTHAGALGRILRVLSSYGIFEARTGGYAHTPASRLLRADHPQSLRSYVLMFNMPMFRKSFDTISFSLRTGKPALDQVFPGGAWNHLATYPEEGRLFNEGMTGKAQGQIAGILASYDFSHFGTIADIGGGHGHLLRAVLASAPKAKGIVFDLPNVTEGAARPSDDRIKFQAGDFFKDALPVADGYLIMQVIHDWSDAEATKILSGIRRAAPAHAKLLLIETLIPETPAPAWAKVIDVVMLTLITGKERTQREYQQLLAGAGFLLERTIAVGQDTSILEAAPV